VHKTRRPWIITRSSWLVRSRLARGLLGLSAVLFAVAALLPSTPDRADVRMPAVTHTTVELPLPAWLDLALWDDGQEAGIDGDGEVGTSPALYVQETRVQAGDTLAAILQRLHVNQPGLLPFLIQDPQARAIYKLYPGRSVQAAVDESGKLAWLRYHHTPAERQAAKDSAGERVLAHWLTVTATQTDTGTTFQAQQDSQPVATHTRLAEGVIQSSLFAATDAAGIPDTITLQMADILNSRVDFARDLRRGDRFRVVYETYSHQGSMVGAGRVLALEFETAKTLHQAIWFAQPGQGNAQAVSGYFDEHGQSLRGMFLRSALKFSRISSTFGMRRHPIHGKWIGHKGVDYAAPSGTPIHATASGTITFIGTQRGYGKVIFIRHNSGYSTVYAHQSRFAGGLKKGSRVEQGQLIGYVGMTGWATGPHLHYEFRVNNAPVNPLSVKVPVAHTLTARQRQAFELARAGFAQQMQMLAALQQGRERSGGEAQARAGQGSDGEDAAPQLAQR